jgi:uncharacterized repeat protein (TIGR03803 family)
VKILPVGYVLAGFLSLAVCMSAQTFTTLYSFDLTDGAEPGATLVQATNGNLYGTTFSGVDGCGGTVFEITAGGVLTTLHCFDGTDGGEPKAGLVQGTNGNLYGTTSTSGANSGGTVFKITPGGSLTSLYSFCSQVNSQGYCADGNHPDAGLVQATNGYIYGTTADGGVSGNGTVFKITPGGTLTTLYNFCPTSTCIDGDTPTSGLVQATNGDLYGTTSGGGASGYGTVFKITPSGTLTTPHSFDGTDGAYPYAGLVEATNGDFYGTTYSGGANNFGTIFKITPGGTLTTLYSFCSQSGCTDGIQPYAGLVEATNGDLYGTTYSGGANNFGTIFKITPSGTLTTLYDFCSQSECADGGRTYAGLIQNTNGNFYGVTSVRGVGGFGTVFSLSVGLGPFVETQTTSGKVGTAVNILGSNLTGATSVTFNGTEAVFKVASRSEITTTVPAGATTGKVNVVTPSGTRSSNQEFRVAP